MAGTDRRAAGAGDVQPWFILVRPQMGENVGAAARAMLNFGLVRLRLVAPLCGWPNAKAVNAASGANVVLNGIEVFTSVRAATADLHRVYATTARPREMLKPVLTGAGAGAEIRARALGGERVGVVFGPERTGLENDEVQLADAIITIPLNPGFASLNLAQAVLLVAYEIHEAGDTTPPREDRSDVLGRATKGDIEQLLRAIVDELDGTSFFRSDDRRSKRIRELELLLQRLALHRAEVQTLRGLVKALTQTRRPPRPRL